MTRIKEPTNRMNTWLFVVFIIAVLAFTIAAEIHINANLDYQISKVIHNPTFVGEVVDKESVTRRVGAKPFDQLTTLRLHIVGQYVKDGDEVVHIDQVFTVTRYWYDRFEVGDLIY